MKLNALIFLASVTWLSISCVPAGPDTQLKSGGFYWGEGVFLIKGENSQKCLDVKDASPADGADIQQWHCYSGQAQQWRLKRHGDHFTIRSVLSGKCLDVNNDSRDNGGKIIQWACTGADNQLFRIEDVEGYRFRIIGKNSGKSIDIADNSRDDGGRVQQWDSFDAGNQKFYFDSIRLPEFVHAEGNRLVDKNGNDLQMNGVNLGNWLVWEGYLMMGDFNYRTHSQFFNSLSQAFGSHDRAREFEREWRLNYVEDTAIRNLKELGFNSVRVPFNYKLFWHDNHLTDEGFEYFDRIINDCRKHGLYVLLDMHGAPGYQNPGDHSDNDSSNASQPRHSVRFWDGDNVDIAARIWQHIAYRYQNEPVIWGYDLINEPVPQDGREYELLPSLVKMRNAIREVDKNHAIVAEGSWWGSDLWKLDWQDGTTRERTGIKSKWDENLVYQIHHYGPAEGTFGREAISNRLGVPLILGEFGESDHDNIRRIKDWAKHHLAGSYVWSFKKMSHDKTLWTIPSNDAYEELKRHINGNSRGSDELFEKMKDFARYNVRNGHESISWDGGFYDAINPR